MNQMWIISVDHQDPDRVKSLSKAFMYASVSKTKWSGHLKRLYNIYQKLPLYRFSIKQAHCSTTFG